VRGVVSKAKLQAPPLGAALLVIAIFWGYLGPPGGVRRAVGGVASDKFSVAPDQISGAMRRIRTRPSSTVKNERRGAQYRE